MFAFIVGNTNFNFNRNGAKNINENNRLKNIEIEIREKIEKIKNFDPDSCYDFSEIGDEFESMTAVSPDVTGFSVSHRLNSTGNRRQKNLTYQNLKTEVISQSGNVAKKMLHYKIWIKWFDIIASILIIAGCLIAQVENESFYYNNTHDRVAIIKLITKLHQVDGKVSDVDLNEYNISYFRNETFLNSLNLSDYYSIPIILSINVYQNSLRICICMFTIISVPLILIGRYAEFIREYIYGQNLEIRFHKSPMINSLIFELLLIIPFQYPGVNGYILQHELGGFLCIPFSSILSAITFIRFYFILKLFKHLTKWTSTTAEHICDKYVCKADMKFAFKAFQKENPFFILFVIFVFTCVCFGLALRTFELLYWETRDPDMGGYQNWEYAWNAMWCIFVSMTTVGYGDFYPKTQIGRFITIIACLIGVYFVSMMMVFMTQKSGLDENEKKAYNLITRLKLRNEIKHKQAYIILNALRMASYKVKKVNHNLDEKAFQIKYSYEKRNIITHIEIIKNKIKAIRTFESISLKESLFDISERIDQDVKEIKTEIESLKFINEIIINFSDCQIEIAKYLKKNCYATKLLYSIIDKKKIFGNLNNVDQNLKNLFETELDRNEYIMDEQDKESDAEEEFEDNIFNYDVNIDQIREYFDFIFQTNKGKKTQSTKASRTVDFIRKKKTTTNAKLKKIQDMLRRKMTSKTMVKELKGRETIKYIH